MKQFNLYQPVMDAFTGRKGKVVKVSFNNGIITYRVNFKGYTEDFQADELKEAK